MIMQMVNIRCKEGLVQPQGTHYFRSYAQFFLYLTDNCLLGSFTHTYPAARKSET